MKLGKSLRPVCQVRFWWQFWSFDELFYLLPWTVWVWWWCFEHLLEIMSTEAKTENKKTTRRKLPWGDWHRMMMPNLRFDISHLFSFFFFCYRGCFLTSSLIGTLSLSLVIPLNMIADGAVKSVSSSPASVDLLKADPCLKICVVTWFYFTGQSVRATCKIVGVSEWRSG